MLDLIDYDTVWKRVLEREPSEANTFLGAFVDWDNSPRRGTRGTMMIKAESKKSRELPKTGGEGASLLALGVGVLLVGGGLLARRSFGKDSSAWRFTARDRWLVTGRVAASPFLRAEKRPARTSGLQPDGVVAPGSSLRVLVGLAFGGPTMGKPTSVARTLGLATAERRSSGPPSRGRGMR